MDYGTTYFVLGKKMHNMFIKLFTDRLQIFYQGVSYYDESDERTSLLQKRVSDNYGKIFMSPYPRGNPFNNFWGKLIKFVIWIFFFASDETV